MVKRNNKKNKNIKKSRKLISRKDSLLGSYWMAKFINKFMKVGNKQVVEKTMFNAFKKIKIKTGLSTQYLFLKILIKFRPLLGFISKRFGKQFKKIPVPLYPRRQTIVSLQWLTMSIKVNRASSFETRIISEFLDLNAGKKTALWKRYADHLSEINENRLNNRFRWK